MAICARVRRSYSSGCVARCVFGRGSTELAITRGRVPASRRGCKHSGALHQSTPTDGSVKLSAS